ncbi:MAG: DUF4405 domain-containing protein [Spirochaetaceae bacterium]|jgi:hypothetical protein|nr:DUF4405 domain-containing protein [Spirochaetaceae bacterium]
MAQEIRNDKITAWLGMRPKMILKMSLDLCMTVIMLFLMAYHLTGDAVHEWLGVSMFVLFIIHNILNFNWYKNLLKGKYTVFRIMQTVINLSVFMCMMCLMISGIIMSSHVFAFLNISRGTSFARIIHLVASHWGFVLMFIHLGLHWGMIMGMMKKALKLKPSVVRTIILRIVAFAIAAYGVYNFIKYDFISYLFLKSMFVFFDYEQALSLFLANYFSMLGLFVFIGYYLTRILQERQPSYPRKSA